MQGGGYGSEFADGSEARKRKSHEGLEDISYKKAVRHNFHCSGLPSKEHFTKEYSREQHRLSFAKFKSLNAYERHRKLVCDYLKYYGGKAGEFANSQSMVKTDNDVLAENHQFVWDDEDDSEVCADKTWGQRLAKKYYDKLFKEYCISDVSRYKGNQFAMRWRTEQEVQTGKGQFICGARKCEEKEGLKTWEVNFAYLEHEVKKNCLIKLRLCPDCSYKLNYHKKHRQIKKERKKGKKGKKGEKSKRRKKSKKSKNDSSSSGSESENDTEKETGGGGPASHPEDDGNDPASIWKQPIDEPTEKTKDDLFDDYLEDLFM